MSKNGRLLKVILLGDGGVGKSSIMNQFVNNKFDEKCYHTIGVEFLNKTMTVDNETYTLQIWDTAGQERFRTLRTPFYRGSDICILTFALDDPASFQNLETWKQEFYHFGDINKDQEFPFLVLGNKCDVDAKNRRVSTAEAKMWCTQNQPTGALMSNGSNSGDVAGVSAQTSGKGTMPYIETSAKNATNISEGFEEALKLWRDIEIRSGRRLDGPDINETPLVDLSRRKFRLFGSSKSLSSGSGVVQGESSCCR